MPTDVVVAPRFSQDARKLQKRYPHIFSDVEPLKNSLANGEIPGDQIPGVGYTVFKVRIRNSDVQRGKSGGYRVVYYLQLVDRIVLLTIYSKSEQSDVTADVIRRIIQAYEAR